MARVKVDWTKVKMAGAEKLDELVSSLVDGIKKLVDSQGIKMKLAKVSINVKEGEEIKQYGACFLKIHEATDAAVDEILSTIKLAGKTAVIDAYNGIQREARLKFLNSNFGDVNEAIDDTANVLVERTGMTLDAAREFVIAQRKLAGMRVA